MRALLVSPSPHPDFDVAEAPPWESPSDNGDAFDLPAFEALVAADPAPVNADLPAPVDWHALFTRTLDDGDDWLVEDFWPARRAISIVADRKAGKSLLVFYVCCCLARGVDPWTHRPRPAVTIAYWDYEMTEDDIYERATEFGLRPDELDRFRYYLLPTVPPLDTPEGGRVVLDTLRRDGAKVTVFDTFGRVVNGDEDHADTVRAYYRNTAVYLKAEGIASARLDHTGHSEKTRARGSSSKGDDIDVAWMLKRGDGNGVTLDHHNVTRLRWVPRTLDLTLVEGPPDSYRRAAVNWPAGTAEVAILLDQLAVPVDAGSRPAGKALRDAGYRRAQNVVQAAQRHRRESTP